MQNKILGVAGCAALMFGLIACSGEDGADGANGTNGLNGTSCEVKSLKDASGYKVLCGGDSVGVLLNGKAGAKGEKGATGATGAKGATGKTGAQGESCTVEPISNGYNVLCGDKVVGTLKNGVNGENGENGQSCKTQAVDDGLVINCAGDIGKIYNGVSCESEAYSKNGKNGLKVTCGNDVKYLWDGEKGEAGDDCSAQEVTDKDTGKKGLQVACGGEVVGTVWNGDDGADCVSEDQGDGRVIVTCGAAEPVTIYKAMCGDKVYDPAEKFCVLTALFDKCGKGSKKTAYNVGSEFCDNGEVVPMCIDVILADQAEVAVEYASMRAPKSDEFCWNGFITKKCNGKEFSDYEYCGKTADRKKDSLMTYCTEKPIIDKLLLDLQKRKLTIDVEDEEDENDPLFGLIGLFGYAETPYAEPTLKWFYKKLDSLKVKSTQFCAEGFDKELHVFNKCGDATFDVKKEFCDRRDNHIYKVVEIEVGEGEEVESQIWMAENLAFKYRLPKVEGGRIKIAGSNVSFVDDAYENFENKDNKSAGRYYTWASAMGQGDDRSSLTNFINPEDELQSHNLVVGACPEDWRLPTMDELQAVIDARKLTKSVAKGGLNVTASGYYDVKFTTDATTNEASVTTELQNDEDALLWTINDSGLPGIVANGAKAVALMYPHDSQSDEKAEFAAFTKDFALPIRCVYDPIDYLP